MLRVECNRCKSVFDTDRRLMDNTAYGAYPVYCSVCQKEWEELLAWQERLKAKAETIIKRKFEAKKIEWLDFAAISEAMLSEKGGG